MKGWRLFQDSGLADGSIWPLREKKEKALLVSGLFVLILYWFVGDFFYVLFIFCLNCFLDDP